MKVTLNPEHPWNQGEEFGDYTMEWHLEPEDKWYQGYPTFRPDEELSAVRRDGKTSIVDCIFMAEGIEHAIEDGRIIPVEPLRISFNSIKHTMI